MRHVEVHAIAPGRSPEEVFALLVDFERYASYSDAVRRVTATKTTDHHATSRWEVNFRQGILQWAEEDFIDADALSIVFRQTEGDAEHFSGEWTVEQVDGGCRIKFVAAFDMGIPSLCDIIEPIAEQALQENIRSIVSGLLSARVEFLHVDPASST